MITVNYVNYRAEEQHYTRVWRPEGLTEYLLVEFLTPAHVVLNDRIAAARPSSCILYSPGFGQDYSALREAVTTTVAFSAPAEEIAQYNLRLNEVFLPGDAAYIDSLLASVNTEYYTRAQFYQQQMASWMNQLFVYFSREAYFLSLPEEPEQHLYNLFCQARYTMLSNCEKEWASTNMSEMVSMGRSQFYKYYNEFFGISPMADLQAARIEKAKNLLTNREVTVTEAAERCGYASIHHFSRTFKEHCGTAPLAWSRANSVSETDDDKGMMTASAEAAAEASAAAPAENILKQESPKEALREPEKKSKKESLKHRLFR